MRYAQPYSRLDYYFRQFLFNKSKLRHLKEFVLRRVGIEHEVPLRPELVYNVLQKSYLYVYTVDSHVFGGLYENKVSRYLIRKIKELKPCLFIDIGSYVGYYSLLAAREGCYVLSFEPDPRNFVLLRNNITLHGFKEKIHIFNKALCREANSKVRFALSRSPSASSYTKFLEGDLADFFITVECVSLDYITSSFRDLLHNKSLIVKIDVEGAGWDILKGGLNTIRVYRPLVVFEIHRTFDENCESKAIKVLQSLNYRFKILEFRNFKNFIAVFEHHT